MSNIFWNMVQTGTVFMAVRLPNLRGCPREMTKSAISVPVERFRCTEKPLSLPIKLEE
jgi:hypothetical protein